MEFLNWAPSQAAPPEEASKADGLPNDADLSSPPQDGIFAAAALPALKTLAESVVEEAPQSGIRRIVPGPGTVASGAVSGAALVGAAVGGVVFFWNTNTSVKPWMDELNPKTGQPYQNQEEYEEVKQNPPEAGSMRGHRKQPQILEMTDPWAEDGPDAASDTGDPCDRPPFANITRCDLLSDNYKYDDRNGAFGEAERFFGKGPYRTSPAGSNRTTSDRAFPPHSTHETYLTPNNDKFSIGSTKCCEVVAGQVVIRTRWSFLK